MNGFDADSSIVVNIVGSIVENGCKSVYPYMGLNNHHL